MVVRLAKLGNRGAIGIWETVSDIPFRPSEGGRAHLMRKRRFEVEKERGFCHHEIDVDLL